MEPVPSPLDRPRADAPDDSPMAADDDRPSLPGAEISTSGVADRIARGMAAGLGGVALTLLIQLVSVPVLLGAWGVPVYGEWLVLSAFPTYLALSDLSFSSVAGNSMVMLEAQGNRSEVIRLGRHVWSIVTLTTGIGVVAAIVIAFAFGGAFGTDAAIASSEARLVLLILFIQVALTNQHGVLDAWYRASGRYPLGASMYQLGRLTGFGALIVAALLGARPATAAGAFLAGSAVGFAVSWLVLRRAVPWSSFALERPHGETVRRLLVPGAAFMILATANAISVQGMTIAVGVVLGASSVVIFTTARTVTRFVSLTIGAVGSSSWPELSRSVGRGDLQEARAILRGATQVSLAIALSLAAVLAILGNRIIGWWTRGAVDPPQDVLLLLLLVVVLNAIWWVPASVLAATNRHQQMAVLYLAATLAAVLAAVPLMSVFGLVGPALSLLASDVFLVVAVLPVALRMVNDAPGRFLRALLDAAGAIRRMRATARSA
jgi:O-antigen/teichoic acid export membrane protein